MEEKEKKILLVEDDPFISELYQRKLGENGFKVKMAKDGEMAIFELKHFKPDLILLDIMLPKKSGWEVLKELKEIKKESGFKIVMLSNLGERDKIEQALEMGADDYLIKASLTPSELVEMIKNKILIQ